jgi:hypothetical protein
MTSRIIQTGQNSLDWTAGTEQPGQDRRDSTTTAIIRLILKLNDLIWEADKVADPEHYLTHRYRYGTTWFANRTKNYLVNKEFSQRKAVVF